MVKKKTGEAARVKDDAPNDPRYTADHVVAKAAKPKPKKTSKKKVDK